MCSLCCLNNKWHYPFSKELLSFLIPEFIKNHPPSTPILKIIKQSNIKLLIDTIKVLFKIKELTIIKILDIISDVKDLITQLVNTVDNTLSIPLSLLATKREFLNYEIFLN